MTALCVRREDGCWPSVWAEYDLDQDILARPERYPEEYDDQDD